jgi:hypothetical protein
LLPLCEGILETLVIPPGQPVNRLIGQEPKDPLIEPDGAVCYQGDGAHETVRSF